jgi:hypothetical protein
MRLCDQHLHHPKDLRDLVDASRQTVDQQLMALLVAAEFANHLLLRYQVVENYDGEDLHSLFSLPKGLPAHDQCSSKGKIKHPHTSSHLLLLFSSHMLQ